ncbi:Lytic transglycosylase catalytic (plasmid) [Halomonas sp. KO116]|nr:transglycosylase SLT domain-containing protein [Halomonas sp. KO116]AJY53235.1 Lytic transglycosylase catalytic [Halomonas sp. KO116]
MKASKILSALAVASTLTAFPLSASASLNHAQQSSLLSGTMYEAPARAHNIDPLLLYSVALAESAWRGANDGEIQPWPYTLRVVSEPGNYQPDLSAAQSELQGYLERYTSIDIGLMQVNSRYHGHRVSSLAELLIPEKNLLVGAEILRETIDSAPNDLQLGIGRYHHWSDEVRARSYGARILAIYNNLLQVLK